MNSQNDIYTPLKAGETFSNHDNYENPYAFKGDGSSVQEDISVMSASASYGNPFSSAMESVFSNTVNNKKATESTSSSLPKVKVESLDFVDSESVIWRKHQLMRYSMSLNTFFTPNRKATIYKWALVILLGVIVGLLGVLVLYTVRSLTKLKFDSMNYYVDREEFARAFFTYLGISIGFAVTAGVICIIEPSAAGSGIAEIKAYLNGINLYKSVRIRTLLAKVIGMMFSTSSGLPIGKEGPMIHAGSIVGAALSQGRTLFFGADVSWTKFQDLRNDKSKRDFVTYGAVAGVAAAFSAPIGGTLFALEEGASYWSLTLTLRAFFAAMIVLLTGNLTTGIKEKHNLLGVDQPVSMFDFGQFDDFDGYHTYELFIFIMLGCVGGLVGAFFNYNYKQMYIWRMDKMPPSSPNYAMVRILELIILSTLYAFVSFILPLSFSTACTAIPTNTDDYPDQEMNLLNSLVRFQCDEGEYNQLASLYLTEPDTALQQLFHFVGQGQGEGHHFNALTLLLFVIPYFLMAVLSAGSFCPAGLFVPTLVSGAALGRLVGLILNSFAHGYVTNSGMYALLGAAAVLGGMSRMTICGVVIMIEASGNSSFLLPLMLIFASARYMGNIFNEPMYDLQIKLKNMNFLQSEMPTVGLLNYHPISEIMHKRVVTLYELQKVDLLVDILKTTSHNGFPIISRSGQLRGFILRKHLCTLLKFKAFSFPLSSLERERYGSKGNSSLGAGDIGISPSLQKSLHVEGLLNLEDDVSGRGLDKDANQDQDKGKMKGEGKGADDFDNRVFLKSSNPFAKSDDRGERLDKVGSESFSSNVSELRKKLHLSINVPLAWEKLEQGSYPKHSKVEDSQLLPHELDEAWMDLRQYMEEAPIVIHEKASIKKVYQIFRTLGLRHLIVVNHNNNPVGIITRKDLFIEKLRKYWASERDHILDFMRIDRSLKGVEQFATERRSVASGDGSFKYFSQPFVLDDDDDDDDDGDSDAVHSAHDADSMPGLLV